MLVEARGQREYYGIVVEMGEFYGRAYANEIGDYGYREYHAVVRCTTVEYKNGTLCVPVAQRYGAEWVEMWIPVNKLKLPEAAVETIRVFSDNSFRL